MLDDHTAINAALDRLRAIADALDAAAPYAAAPLIQEAQQIVENQILPHEHADETQFYPLVRSFLPDGHGLAGMSRAHREIKHLARLLGQITMDFDLEIPDFAVLDPYLIRDAQHVVETLEALVRLHNAQEKDIYEYAVAGRGH